MNYNKRNAKGTLAEQYVIEHYKKLGYVLYAPLPKQGKAHLIDLFIMKMDGDEKVLFALEVKTQPTWKGKDTGVDCYTILERHWKDYKLFVESYDMHLHILFVDWDKMQVFSSRFSALMDKTWETHRNKDLYEYPQLVEPHAGMNDREMKYKIPERRVQLAWEITDEEKQKFNQ